jgi:TRAP-type mannitol/chloroaromatic compound transport system permease small subunit
MLNAVIKAIDAFIDAQGKIMSFLIYPLLLIVLYEVVKRYVFNAPTVWGFEATTFSYGLHYMFGLSFMERHNGHVSVDIVTSRLSKKTQAIISIVTYLTIFTPVYFFMTVGSIKFAYASTVQGELNSTSWAPPIWPFKILMAVSFGFLLLMGIGSLLKQVRMLKEAVNESRDEVQS